jgi:hypothetical protein
LREQEEDQYRGKVKEKSAAEPEKVAVWQRRDIKAVQQVPEIKKANNEEEERFYSA